MNNSILTKKDLINDVASCLDETTITKKALNEVFTYLFEEIKANVSLGKDIRIADFGTFKPIDKPQTTGTNPRTGEKVVIPAHRIVKFVPAKAFKDELKK